MQPVRLAEHLPTPAGSSASSTVSSQKDGSDSWSFSSGFSKDATAEAWATYGSLHHSPPHVKATMKTINRGSYLPTQPTTSTSHIVDQALNVVKSHVESVQKQKEQKQEQLLWKMSLHETQLEPDDSPPSLMASETSFSSVDYNGSNSCTGACSSSNCSIQDSVVQHPSELQSEDSSVLPLAFRKIAKKRKKEKSRDGMDRSSFHHTKSSKEYLRKAQEALINRDQQERGEQSDDSRGAPVPFAKEVAERLLSAPPSVFARQGPGRSSWHDQTASEAASDVEKFSPPPRSTSGLSRSQSFGDLKVKSSSACKQLPSSQSDDDSNPYGYEDPDVVAAGAPSRRMGTARRRGSVTKFSLKAAENAKAATERIMKLQGLKCKQESPGVSPERRSATPTGRRSHPRRSVGMFTNVDLQQESRSIDPMPVVEAHIRQRSIPLGDWDTPARSEESLKYVYEDLSGEGHSSADSITAPSRTNSNPYGYEYPGADTNGTAAQSSSDLYGYGEPNACTKKNEPDQYGYENPDTQPQAPRRRHPRPTRRGSVTKFSVGAASIIAAATESVPEPTSTAQEVPSVSANFSTRDTVDQETEEDLVGDLEPTGVLDSFLSNHSPYLVSSQYYHHTSVSRVNSSHSDAADSGDCLSRGILSTRQGISPRRTGSYRRPHRFTAEHLRSDSMMSHGSGVSFEDDADSLAPDMESLCSIHDRSEDNDFPPMPPLQPAKSPLTPRDLPNRSRSGGSSRGGLLARRTYSNGSLSSDGFHLQPKRTPSGRTGLMVSVPAEADFAILPFGGLPAPAATDSPSEYLMPAPVKRNPSTSSTMSSVKRTPSNSSSIVPYSIHAALPLTEASLDGRMRRRASLAT
jgi:hypothetical protein